MLGERLLRLWIKRRRRGLWLRYIFRGVLGVDMDYEDEMGYKKGIFAYAVRQSKKETSKEMGWDERCKIP